MYAAIAIDTHSFKSGFLRISLLDMMMAEQGSVATICPALVSQ
jgi:hypothetical protein